MIHVTLAGSPYEIGFQHGQALRVLVDAMVRYESRRHAHVEAAPLDLVAVVERVRRVAPALVAELRGIADGSGLPFDLLLEVNLRVLHYCTVVAFTQADVGPLLGKNLDFVAYAYQVLFTVHPDKGHAMTHVGCAGSVASYGGLNAAGLAMGHAVVPLDDAPEDDGLPVAFLRRLALEHCEDTSEAVVFLSQYDAWRTGDSLLFLDRSGEAAVVEMLPGAQRVRRPVKGAIWCTNCFVHPDLAAGKEEARQRYRYIEGSLRRERSDLTRGFLHRLLSSHDGQVPLCRDSTQLSFVAHPASGRLEVADGYPCQVDYVEVSKQLQGHSC
jgi:isopenicillin-N N-acyltransferase-like protein